MQTMIDPQWWWAGLIWSIAMGWAASSYASNFIYRLPRHEYPFGRTPYCGDCNAPLKPIDLAPVVSWLMTRGKCRYCDAPIPISYFYVELVFPLLFGMAFALYGYNDKYILMVASFSLLVVQAMMAYEDDYFSPGLTVFLAVLGLLVQALYWDSVLDGLLHGFFAFFAALALCGLAKMLPANKDLRLLPHGCWLAAVAGIWLGVPAFALVIAIWGITYFLLGTMLDTNRVKMRARMLMAFSPALIAGIIDAYPF